MNTVVALLVSVLLLAANGFFVAAEFAFTASRVHRLERRAHTSRGARAALRSTRELSAMLAGAQLGITLCSLGLGALAEPAIAHLVEPLLHGAGLPAGLAYAIAFVLALALITLLHIVVGEMAPKSYVISHPEASATVLALPFRGYARVVRPALRVLNGLANRILRLARIEPVDEVDTARDPAELRSLLRQSRDAGRLPPEQYRMLDGTLALRSTTLADLMVPRADMVSVPAGATGADVVAAHLATGRSRLPVTDDGDIVGVVHVRDAARATGTTAAALASAPLRLDATTDAYAALRTMRDRRTHLALVGPVGAVAGLVTLEDLVEQLIGDFADETDRLGPTRAGSGTNTG